MSAQIAPLHSNGGAGSGILDTTAPDRKHVCSRFLRKHPPDLYGQCHAIETPKCVSDSLRLLEKELSKLPDEIRAGIEQASVICPEIYTSSEHRLLFLRCEQFNADVSSSMVADRRSYAWRASFQLMHSIDAHTRKFRHMQLAALRMAKYWNKRIELFSSRAFVPFSAADMKEKDGSELSLGFLRLVPEGTDGTGRCNIYVDPTVLEGHEYKVEGVVRAAWYTLHTALLENESTQQKGIVFLVYLRNAYPWHFDRSLVQALSNSIRGVLPVRVSAIHIFHAPYLFEVLFDVVSVLLGERLTRRMKMYSGEDSLILDDLSEFGILPSRIPVDLGGSLELDQDRWIAEQESAGK